MTIAYLNGVFQPLEKTFISATDRGFLFGDGVYETIPVYHEKPFRLEQHLQRLQRSLEAIQLFLDFKTIDLPNIIQELIKQNQNGKEQAIYLQVTRGNYFVRDHNFPSETKPTIFAYSFPATPKTFEELSLGITAITTDDLRWERCDIKAITLLPNVLARQQAIAEGAQEAIFIRNNLALEGCISNLFMVENNVIYTPPCNHHILGGITRDLILELAKQYNYLYQEKNITANELQNADEIWLTSSTREITPVVKLNENPIGGGQPGPLWFKMYKHYQDFKQQVDSRSASSS